jgi:hypothetical protein
LFPITTCHQMKKQIPSEPLQWTVGIIKGLVDQWIEWIEKSHLNSDVKTEIKKFIGTLTVDINKCTILKSKASFESEVLSSKISSSTNYIDRILKLSEYEEFRYKKYDEIYGRGLVQKFSIWNSWYDDAIHTMVIPPGLLYFPTREFESESCQIYSHIGTVFGHELFHVIYRKLKQHLFEFPEFSRFQDRISALYGPNSDVEENLADWTGLYHAYQVYNKRTKPSDSEKKCFMLSYTRLWCDSESTSDGEHATGLQRGILPLHMLNREWNELFQCTYSDDLSNNLFNH